MPRPDADRPRYAAGAAPAGRSRAAAPPRFPGPRQEYLDAFDGVGPRTGARGNGRADGATGHRTGVWDGSWSERRPDDRGGASVPAPAASGRPDDPWDGAWDGDTGTGTHRAVSAADGRSGGPPHRHRRVPEPRRRGRGRTLTGLAAAGVVTVLAITITGQLADTQSGGAGAAGDRTGPADTEPQPEPDGAAERSQSRGPVATEPDTEPEPPSYDEVMDTVLDLDPELTASGTLVPVPGTEPGPSPDAPEQLRYRVDVEEGLDIEPALFAEAVHRTLSDPRSWGNDGRRSFTRVASGNHDFVITLASPGTTAEWCAKSGLDTTVENVSCDSSNTERVMINAWRWAQGAQTYGPDRIHEYRQMLINHEVGHRIGYGHAVCPAHGAPAPVMMQQTKFLTLNGLTCEPNAWPSP